MKVKVRKGGRLTLPKKVRKQLGIGENSDLNAVILGPGVWISRKPLVADQPEAPAKKEWTQSRQDLLTRLQELHTDFGNHQFSDSVELLRQDRER